MVADIEQLGLLFDASLDAVVSMDAGGLVIDWNRQAEAIFGWSAKEAIDAPLTALIVPPQHREAHMRGLAHYLATNEGPVLGRRIEVTALRRNGEEFPVELAITPMRHDGQVFFTAFLRDISNRRQMEARLQRQALEAQLLYRVASSPAETGTFQDALRHCVDSVCELTGWPIGHALVPGRDGTALTSSGVWQLPDHLAGGDLQRHSAEMRFAPGVGLPGHVWRTDEPHWIVDVNADSPPTGDPLFVRAHLFGDLGVRSAFAFPVKLGAEVIAVLEFFTIERRELDPQLLLMARSIGEQAGRALERVRAAERQTFLMRELDHRVKNILATIQSIAARTLSSSDEVRDFTSRLHSLSRTHNLLAYQRWSGAMLHEIVRNELMPYMAGGARADISGEDLLLTPKQAQVLTLIFHELSTNAAKHGALSVPGGAVSIASLVRHGDNGRHVEVDWRESGGPRVEPPSRRGFGRQMIERGVAHELQGRTELSFAPEGLRCSIEVPLID